MIQLEHDFEEDLQAVLALARVEPEFFFTGLLNVQLYSWQRQTCERIARKVRNGERRIKVLVRSCHGAGKTFFAAGLVLWWTFTRVESRGLTTAPTWAGVEELLWPQIATLFTNSRMRGWPCFKGARILNTKLEISDTWFAIGASSDHPANLEGHHGARAAMRVVDEAKAVEESVFEATEGLLNAPEALDVWISTPSIQSGPFYLRDVEADSSLVRAVVTVDDLIADYRRHGFEELGGAEAWKQDRLQKWGQNSPAFQSRAMADYIVESGDQALFPVAWVDRAMQQTFELRSPLKLGQDVAGSVAGDRNAMALCAGPDDDGRLHVRSLESWYEQDTMVSKGRAVNGAERAVAEFGVPVLHRVDTIGIGKGVCDQLGQEQRDVEAYRASDRPTSPDLYANRKAEDAWALRRLLELGKIRLPHDAALRADMAAMKYEITPGGKLRVVDPEKSPDLADAVIIATAPPGGAGANVVEFYRQRVGEIARRKAALQ